MPNICLLITSRPIENIGVDMQRLNPVNLKIRAFDEDIKSFISCSIEASRSLVSFMKQDLTLHDRIVNTILDRASGIYETPEFGPSPV